MFSETHRVGKGCPPLNRDRIFKSLWVELAGLSRGSEKTICTVGPEKMALPRRVWASVQLSVIIIGGGDWGGPILLLSSAGSPDLHLSPLHLSGVYRAEAAPFGTQPVFISALRCLISVDLTYTFVRARPPQCRLTRPLKPGTLWPLFL